jgi:thiosulfate/3-mercaptopyruvate sulfurtransferase
MTFPNTERPKRILASVSLIVVALLSLAFFLTAAARPATDPWPASQALQASDLARELGDTSKDSATIVYVGFRTLFLGGHVLGASFHGTTSTEDGLAEFKKWAATLPHSTNLVIYCGCCPMEKCPNIRPAYTTLHEMGFTRVRVLVLPTSFAEDWVAKGYPYEKSGNH